MGVSTHISGHAIIQGIQTYGDIQIYVWCPNIWVMSKHGGHANIQGVCKHMEHVGHSNIQGAIQTYGGIQMYWGIWTPPQSDKACFLFVVYAQQASKHTQDHPNIQEASKHRGAQIYRGYPNIGASKHTGGESKYMRASKPMGCPNIWGYQHI